MNGKASQGFICLQLMYAYLDFDVIEYHTEIELSDLT